MLARHFLDRAVDDGLARKVIGEGALALLETHDWPGNVRELENLMRRLAALVRDERIDAADVSRMLGSAPPAGGAAPDEAIDAAVRRHIERLAQQEPRSLDDGSLYQRIIAEVERPLIEAMLARHGGNQLRTARAMGLNRNTLRKRLDVLGIDPTGSSAR